MKQAAITPHEARYGFFPPKWLRDFLIESARAWNLSITKIVIIEALPFVIAAAGVLAALLGKNAYKWFVGEDGFAEYMQVGVYSLAFFLSLFLARRHQRAGDKVLTFLYLGLSAGLFFLVGEELSWGQRIFGWQTSEAFAARNKQEETNFHNIYGVEVIFKWAQLLVGSYSTILPLVVLRWEAPERFGKIVPAVIPHYSLVPYFIMMFLWRLFRNLTEVPEKFYYVVSEYNEVIELILALGVLLFLVFQIRRLKQDRGWLSNV